MKAGPLLGERSVTRTSIPTVEAVLWLAAAALVVLLVAIHGGGAHIRNDNYQYLSTAASLEDDLKVTTSIVHFDVERRSGEIPAPLTTFPPGFPLAIAGLSLLGLSGEAAGLVVSAATFVALFPLVVWAATLLDVSRPATRLVLFGLLANAAATRFSTAVRAESLFAAIVTFALVLFMKRDVGERAGNGDDVPALVAGAVLLGLSYWIRYAGLLVFAGMGAVYGARAVIRRDRRSLLGLASLGISGMIIGLGMLRNVVITGSWQGGNDKAVTNDAVETAKALATAARDLLVAGGNEGVLSLPLDSIFFGTLAVVVVVVVRAIRRSASPTAPWQRSGLMTLVAVVATYGFGMLYLGLFTVITIGPRMLYPMLPALLLAAGILFTRTEQAGGPAPPGRSPVVLAGALLAVAYGLSNLWNITTEPQPAPHERVETRLASTLGDGRTVEGWIDGNIPGDAIIIAADGQATSYVLSRSTVSLVMREFSETTWNEPEVRRVAQQYAAGFLILYPGADLPVQQESRFLAGLILGDVPPWLSLGVETSAVSIYRIR